MWSDAARKASAEARKANGHNAEKGNRAVAKHVKKQHKSAGVGAMLKGQISYTPTSKSQFSWPTYTKK